MLYLNETEVTQLLPMLEAVRLMRMAFEALAHGEAKNQPRRRLILPTGAVLHSLAGACGPYFGTKFYSTHPKHGAHFFFMLFDSLTAKPLALMEANHLGQIRTGAASGYATDLLANPDSAIVGIIGSGFQAKTQLEAIRAVRTIKEVRVWSRSPEKRQRFAKESRATEAASAEAAIVGADIVITATNAKDPVIQDSWVRQGTHVNAMGSNIASRTELPAELVKRSRLIAVDSLEQAKTEAGELILADSWSNVVELQTVRRNYDPTGVTIFKSIGIGLEDVAAGGFVYESALRKGMGRDFGSSYS